MELGRAHNHTFTWYEYRISDEATRDLTGRDYLQAMRDGSIPPPPFVCAMGFALAEIDDGRVVFTLAPEPFMNNGIGLLHGGVAATLFDTAVGCACMTVTPLGKVAVTLDLAVRYFKPLTLASGTIRCEGQVINIGRTTITAEGRLFDAGGRLCGHATSTLALIVPATPR